MGILLAVKEALARGFPRVEFEGDCQNVINLINSNELYLFELGKIVDEIKSFNCGHVFHFIFGPRLCNRLAHDYVISVIDEEI